MKGKENMDPTPEHTQYPASIINLLKKYPTSPVVIVKQVLNERDFEQQKSKQLEYHIEGGAIGIVTTADNKVVLTRRTKPHSGWALPGGRVEQGEMFDNAFIREVKEECGVDIEVSSLIVIENKEFISPKQESIQFWLAVFKATTISNNLPYQTEDAIKEGLEIGLFMAQDLPVEMILQDREKLMKHLGIDL